MWKMKRIPWMPGMAAVLQGPAHHRGQDHQCKSALSAARQYVRFQKEGRWVGEKDMGGPLDGGSPMLHVNF